jgi:IPT/TIG domain
MSDTVVITSGETVQFPVPSDHPLAKYQQQVGLSELGNLHDLAVAQMLTQTNPKLTTDQVAEAVGDILASANQSTVLQLEFGTADIVVEEGASMVLDGPITTLTAGNVIVLGEIVAHGSLNITSSTCGGTPQPVISSIDPSTGSTTGTSPDQVLIQGNDLANVTAVNFGGTPSPGFTVGDDGTIEADVPPGSAGPVDIVVGVGGLMSSPNPAAVFTYVYEPGVASINVPGVLFTGQSATGTFTLNEPAPSGGTTVELSVSNSFEEATFVTAPATVPVPGGATSATFTITTPATAFGWTTIGAAGPGGDATSATAVISEDQIGLILALPDQAPGSPPVDPTATPDGATGVINYIKVGHTATGTVLVRNPAPTSGDVITLRTNANNVVSITPTVVDPTTSGGGTSATFTVTALSVGEFTISADYLGDSATIGPFPAYEDPPPPPPPHPIHHPKNGPLPK